MGVHLQLEFALRQIKPCRDNLLVGCACMFTWCRLADLRADEEIEFVGSQWGIAGRKPAGYRRTAACQMNGKGALLR
ncbi:hypothetical protein EDC39_11068 [Geothermobacter ehrlichii]|uniref:Uncharacterized protein n=1 Tax=Geothermobacter ehrlichii TaxID=213224 RepID=A0A5D3WK74_9BACT|nr:hypothetical protein EDC39_11068 [Geothermobacter ehrlichii]